MSTYEEREKVRVPEILARIGYDLSNLELHVAWIFQWYSGTAGSDPAPIRDEYSRAFADVIKKIKEVDTILHLSKEEIKAMYSKG